MEIVRSWREIKIMLKWRFSILCDADFEYKEGEKEIMLDRLASKIQKSRQELSLVFSDLQKY